MATALYRRYRPETFADVIGQDHVTVPLMRALRNGRIGHAYLFSGPRGCGKTTSARILARCLNCAEGPTDTPCGHCDSCRDLARGGPGSLDVVEIDAASHGGVDDARELRERATFAPARDRYKVFIIDEAHMVTSAGFNALLKLVEEPPEHVKFVFATTEPEKVIGTIRSRTHHYPFRLIPPQVLGPYLEQVCRAEGVEVGEGVLPLVIRAGAGSARDTLSVLDQLMAGAGEHGLDHATAIALLGFTDTELLDRTITAIGARDPAGMYGAVEQVIASGQEPRRFVEDVLERLRDLIVLGAVPDRGADLLPELPADELARMREEIEGFEVADLSRCGDLVHETLSTMSGATSPRLHLELLAARLVLRDERAAFAPAASSGPASGQGRGAPTGRGSIGQQGEGASGGASVTGGQGAPAASGRDRARQIAEQQAASSRRTREEERGAERGAGRTAQPARGRDGSAAESSDRTGQGAPSSQAVREPSQRSAPQASSSSSQNAPREAPRAATAPAAAAPAPGAAAAGAPVSDDDWGPVALIGRELPADERAAGTASRAGQDARVPAQGASAPAGDAAAPAPVDDDRAAPMHGGVRPGHAGEAPAQTRTETPPAAAASASGGGLDADEVRGRWPAILDELQQIRRPSWALVAQNAHVHATDGSTLVLGFATDGLLSAFRRGTSAENLADAIRRVLGREVTVEAVVGEDPGPGGSGHGGTGDGGNGDGGHGGGRPGGGTTGPEGGRRDGGGPAQGSPTRDRASSGRGREDAAGQRGSGSGATSAGSGPAPGIAALVADDRAARSAAGASDRPVPGPPAVDEDLPPEPDDPYPPDPYDEGGAGDPYERRDDAEHRGGAEHRDSVEPRDSTEDRDSTERRGGSEPSGGGPDARTQGSGPSRVDAGPTHHAEVRSESAPSVSPPEAPGASGDRTPLVIPDDSRDDLPDDQPRTHGHEALRRAIAEGRPVRTEPRSRTSGVAAPDGGSEATGAAPAAEGPTPQDTAPGAPADDWPPLAADGRGPRDPSASGSRNDRPAPVERGGARGPEQRSDAPAGDASPRSRSAHGGAALVREAALASRHAPQRHGASWQGASGRGDTPPTAPEDPTGGASRDDEDATLTSRRPQELVTELLGGTVLEVIDDSR
ncbi:DNA polymerase III subunit gamma and tau [Brachybacterium sp. AOP25-B2-12]|uniref:DNA polymerase III subunit gamma and tau n=1 Tax=Brachybacterium sp. AOP25-B2-12 TaxID=3457710 RepID=UPI004033947F